MRKSVCLVSLIGLMFLHMLANSQGKEAYNWHFGHYAGLTWNVGHVATTTSASSMATNEGCSSISDADGNLLLYTDGSKVWNRNHVVLPNSEQSSIGGWLHGDGSATQSAVIVPKPHDPNIYYIFTVDANLGSYGCSYSVVDMNLMGGTGDVVSGQKNIPLFTPSSEKICVVRHQNGVDYWIVTHPWNKNVFHSYLLKNAGLSSIPVVSATGLFYTGGANATRGYLKASADGAHIAAAISGFDTYELFSFDNSTGVLDLKLSMPANYTDAYGVEFSPNGNYLYGSNRWGNSIYQWDLSSGVDSVILASEVQIGTLSDATAGALQLAPDKNIYIARKNHNYLSAIFNADSAGMSSGFQEYGVMLAAGTECEEGLPSFVHLPYVNADFSFTYCTATADFQINNTLWLDSVKWNFGDTLSPNNTDNGFTPSHYFISLDTFMVELIVYGYGLSDTIVQPVYKMNAPVINLTDTAICEGETLVLDATSAYANYAWSTGQTTALVNLDVAGVYYVTVSNNCGSAIGQITLSFYPSPIIDFGADTLISLAETFLLAPTVVNADTYLWSTTETTAFINVTQPGFYNLTATSVNGCETEADVLVDFFWGIDEYVQEQNQILLYPNPANQQLYLNFKEMRIRSLEIYSSMGQLMFVGEITEPACKLNVSRYEQGIYFVKIHAQNGETRIKPFSIVR